MFKALDVLIKVLFCICLPSKTTESLKWGRKRIWTEFIYIFITFDSIMLCEAVSLQLSLVVINVEK